LKLILLFDKIKTLKKKNNFERTLYYQIEISFTFIMGGKHSKNGFGEPEHALPIEIPQKTPELTEEDFNFLTAQTGQTRNDIKYIFDKFMLNNTDFKLDKVEFVKLYISLRPESPESLDEISEFVFRAFDKDKSGSIDFNEFMISYTLTSRGDLEQKLDYAFNLYDADNSGYLEANEIKPVIWAMFDLMGADKKGQNIHQIVQECMKELDTEPDAKITKGKMCFFFLDFK
jgi:Ca2+-binding EF-hand superfamily protein